MEPRKLYFKNVATAVTLPGGATYTPTMVLQFREWSSSQSAGYVTSPILNPRNNTDGSTPHLRPGSETVLYADAVSNWTTHVKTFIAQYMIKGLLEVREDYLGTVRELQPWQMINYVSNNQPWTHWVTARSETGTPVVADAVNMPVVTPPAAGNIQDAHNFTTLRARVTIVAGTTIDVEVYSRGNDLVWVLQSTHAALATGAEFTFTTNNQDVFLKLAVVGGAPTAVSIDISA